MSPKDEVEPPLYVDLDGTILTTDLLYESFVSAVRSSPWVALQCIGWLMQGRARLKEELAARARIDFASLPTREPVMEFLRREKARGRRIYLATASWSSLAESAAAHLGVFDGVVATSREGNMKGEAKAERIVQLCGEKCFDYVGDSSADLAVWRRSRYAYVVEPSDRLSRRVPEGVAVKQVFRSASGLESAKAAVRAMRPHQWAKNLLLFVPLVAAHRAGELALTAQSFLGFAAFCLAASSAYLLNDVLDVTADRAHPRKRRRPFASGDLSIPSGIGLCIAALAASAAIAAMLPAAFQLSLVVYLVVTVAYSFSLKREALVDVIALAGLYTLRIIAGALVVGALPSFWLLAFSMFLFFSLALVKRYAEVVTLEGGAMPGRGYSGSDLEVIRALGTGSAIVSALVLALYINGETAKDLYSRPAFLWLLCPLVLYWLSRVWLLAGRGQMHDDPLIFALQDRASWVVAVMGAIVVAGAT